MPELLIRPRVLTPYASAEFAVVRLSARIGDLGLYYLVLRLVLRPLGFLPWPVWFDWYASVAASVFVNASLLRTFGRTPWKAAVGLLVETPGRRRPTFVQAFWREFLATAIGMAFGIPPLAPIAILISGARLLQGKRTIWSKLSGLRTIRTDFLENLHRSKLGILQAALFALGLIVQTGVVMLTLYSDFS
jgi:hypothetical protein